MKLIVRAQVNNGWGVREIEIPPKTGAVVDHLVRYFRPKVKTLLAANVLVFTLINLKDQTMVIILDKDKLCLTYEVNRLKEVLYSTNWTEHDMHELMAVIENHALKSLGTQSSAWGYKNENY